VKNTIYEARRYVISAILLLFPLF